MKSALEVWVPRDPSSGRPGAPTPKRNLGILNCRNVTHSFTNHPLPPGIERKGHTHIHPHMVIKSQVCRHKAEGKTGKYCTVNCRGPPPTPCLMVANLGVERCTG